MSTRVATYLDTNAGAPLHPAAVEALLPFLRSPGGTIGNASSIHTHGRRAKRALAQAREQIAQALGPRIDPEQLIFTSSGSEANQLAIRSILEPSSHWITTPVEHDSIRQLQGKDVSHLSVNAQGEVDPSGLQALIRPETRLISTMWVNNETGVITPIEKTAEFANARKIPLHVDAAQAWGKLPVDLNALGAQLVTFSGHKIGGLAGTGVLWLAPGTRARAMILGKQEKGRRGGTENLLGIIALGAAASQLNPQQTSPGIEALRNRLQETLCRRIAGTQVNGGGAPRVAGTLNLSFDGIEGDGLVMALDLAGYSVSSGSACASGVLEPSHVLLAMGRTPKQAMAALRISFGSEMSWEILEPFVDTLEKTVLRLRSVAR